MLQCRGREVLCVKHATFYVYVFIALAYRFIRPRRGKNYRIKTMFYVIVRVISITLSLIYNGSFFYAVGKITTINDNRTSAVKFIRVGTIQRSKTYTRTTTELYRTHSLLLPSRRRVQTLSHVRLIACAVRRKKKILALAVRVLMQEYKKTRKCTKPIYF